MKIHEADAKSLLVAQGLPVPQWEVARTPSQARAAAVRFVADPDNATAWYENIVGVEWKTDPPLRVGSRVAFTARFLGRRLAYTYEIRELVPGERLVMSTAEGPFPMENTYACGDGRADHAGLAMRRANRKDLERLKRILESRT